MGATCPASESIQCRPCEQDFNEGQFEATCSGPLPNGANLQCRCYTQENANPVWTCRDLTGQMTFPACSGGNVFDGPDGPAPGRGPVPHGPSEDEWGPDERPSEDEPPVTPVVPTPCGSNTFYASKTGKCCQKYDSICSGEYDAPPGPEP